MDTNLLVYAHRSDNAKHEAAKVALERLPSQPDGWAIPWPCVHEFLAVVTSPELRGARTPIDIALEAMQTWLLHPGCRALSETQGPFEILAALAHRASLSGEAIHDGRIAALCIAHGVEELWTGDRDFNRFPDLKTRNPLIPSLHEPVGDRYRVPAKRRASRIR